MATTTSEPSSLYFLDPVPMQMDVDKYSSLSTITNNQKDVNKHSTVPNYDTQSKARKTVTLSAKDIATQPLKMFNQLFPNTLNQFNDIQTCNIGIKQKWYYARIRFCGMSFFGIGSKHQTAKADAAKKILLLISDGTIKPQLDVDLHIDSEAFTEDVDVHDYFDFQHSSETSQPGYPKVGYFNSQVNHDNARSNPVNEMLRLYPDVDIMVIEDTTTKGYIGSISIGNHSFGSRGLTKKDARKNAAKVCLFQAYGVLYWDVENRSLKRKLVSLETNNDDDIIRSENEVTAAPSYPVSRLKHFYPEALFSYEEAETDENDIQATTVTISIKDEIFTATKNSKTSAEIAASKIALKSFGCDLKPTKKPPTIDLSQNPLMVYQQIYKNKIMEIESIGTPQQPIFRASVTFDNGKSLSTDGVSVKAAKSDLAVLVFKSFHNIEESSWLYTTPAKRMKLSDGNDDNSTTAIIDLVDEEKRQGLVTKFNNHPVQLLAKICKDIKYDIIEVATNPPVFEASILLNDQHYSAKDSSKKLSKNAVAQKVLEGVYGYAKGDFKRQDAAFEVPESKKQTFPLKTKQHPVMLLSKLCSDVKYNIVEIKPRLFESSVDLNGVLYSARESSKKLARAGVAQKILKEVYKFANEDLAMDNKPDEKIKKRNLSVNVNQHPVMVLSIMCSDIKYDVVETSTKPPQFEASIHCNNQIYSHIDSSKKLAKSAVARKVLREVCGFTDDEFKKEDVVVENIDDISPNNARQYPCRILSRLCDDIKYAVVEVGSKPPLFKASITLKEHIYSANGSSKKLSKAAAARKVLEEVYGFSNDDIQTQNLIEKLSKQEKRRSIPNNFNNNPVSVLSMLYADTKYDFKQISITPPIQEASILLDNKIFSARDSAKKLAKAAVAEKVLEEVYGFTKNDFRIDRTASSSEVTLPSDICDVIELAMREKVTNVTAGTCKPKVFAGFIVEDTATGVFDVVSFGTGTKGLSGNKLNAEGTVLTDCHAEVIARRGFCHYLVSEIENCVNEKKSIVEQKTKKFSLKENIAVYLYINTAPCGDGRLFCHPSSSMNGSNKTIGKLRAKLEGSQGSTLTSEVGPQTLDGILIGERLQSMTCSDKILKWNIVGVQGALLSNIMDPVYIHGIVIGDLYHHDHLNRALYQRGLGVELLSPPFMSNLPLLGTPTTAMRRDLGNPLNYSVNWNASEGSSEAVLSANGQAFINKPSRLCKRSYIAKIKPLLIKYCQDQSEKCFIYKDFKQLAGEYQAHKLRLFAHLSETDAGKWLSKPHEIDMFYVS